MNKEKFKKGQIICHPSGIRNIVFDPAKTSTDHKLRYNDNEYSIDEFELQPIVNLDGTGIDLFHTKTNKLVKTEGATNYWQSTITGWHSGELIKPGELIVLSGRPMVIDEVVERRNHAGEFKDAEHKKNSFYKVKVSYQLPQGFYP